MGTWLDDWGSCWVSSNSGSSHLSLGACVSDLTWGFGVERGVLLGLIHPPHEAWLASLSALLS